jgi:hypothetical protein
MKRTIRKPIAAKPKPKLVKPEPPRPVGPSYGGKMITTRLDASELERVDAIAKAISADRSHYGYGYGKQNRSTAFRTLLRAGLDALEPRYGIKPLATVAK